MIKLSVGEMRPHEIFSQWLEMGMPEAEVYIKQNDSDLVKCKILFEHNCPIIIEEEVQCR